MSSFVAIDFETADNGADSACAIGLVRVDGESITREEVRLIRPPRPHIVYTHIHGITWEQVKDSPDFGAVWRDLRAMLDGADYLVAHNASFDRRVLQACCEAHGHAMPTLPFKCTVQIARKSFAIYPTKLSNVCKVLGIELNHHEALSDARACAQIVLQAQKKTEPGQVAEPRAF